MTRLKIHCLVIDLIQCAIVWFLLVVIFTILGRRKWWVHQRISPVQTRFDLAFDRRVVVRVRVGRQPVCFRFIVVVFIFVFLKSRQFTGTYNYDIYNFCFCLLGTLDHPGHFGSECFRYFYCAHYIHIQTDLFTYNPGDQGLSVRCFSSFSYLPISSCNQL